jgi:hypothetical protein
MMKSKQEEEDPVSKATENVLNIIEVLTMALE